MKKFKKLLCLALALVMIAGLIPINTQAAIRINKKQLTLKPQETEYLNLVGTTKKAKWKTSNKKVCTVDKTGMVKALKEGKATITATLGKKKFACKVTVKYTTKERLQVFRDWLVGDIWNDGLCDLSWYMTDGTDSCGDTMNVDYTVKKLEKAYKLTADYDKFINSLSDYTDIKDTWQLAKEQIDTLCLYAISFDWSTAPIEGGNKMFDTSLFSTYMNDLTDMIDNL